MEALRCGDMNPACDKSFADLERRVETLERALRDHGGIYDMLRKLEVDLAAFTASIKASVKTAVLLGSAIGTILGVVIGAMVALLK